MGGLSLVVGILIVKALEDLSPTLKPRLKWPNDIYVNNQKIGGILIDLMGEANGNCTAIVGIGLNVNMKDEDFKDITQPWTSLEHALDEKLDRNIIVARLMQSILSGLEIFHEKGLAPFLAEWQRYDLLQDQEVSITMGKQAISGIARGINPHGYLLLELPSGAVEPFSYGDTTLLKN